MDSSHASKPFPTYIYPSFGVTDLKGEALQCDKHKVVAFVLLFLSPIKPDLQRQILHGDLSPFLTSYVLLQSGSATSLRYVVVKLACIWRIWYTKVSALLYYYSWAWLVPNTRLEMVWRKIIVFEMHLLRHGKPYFPHLFWGKLSRLSSGLTGVCKGCPF